MVHHDIWIISFCLDLLLHSPIFISFFGNPKIIIPSKFDFTLEFIDFTRFLFLSVEELTGVEVTPELKGVKGLMDAIRSKSKSPAKKNRDVLMTTVDEEGETGSGKECFPVPNLNVRKGLTTMDPDQETVGFLTPKITK
jgi:hypothetical protein